jgi:hypothetical protein
MTATSNQSSPTGQTVSFDFDSTLWDEDAQAFITETVDLLRMYIHDGARVIITTARFTQDEMRELYRILLRLNLSDVMWPGANGFQLKVFSAPGHFRFNGKDQLTKSDVLLREKVAVHFDDLPGDVDLKEAIAVGVNVQMPPATKATIARMYR